MNKKFLPILLTFLLVFSTVSAQSLFSNWNEWFGIPEAWTKSPDLIYFVFVPFLGTFTIIWGILTSTRVKIFEKPKVNVLLSFIFAVALFSSGIMPAIVSKLFAYGGVFGVIAFFILFFVLTTLFSARKIERSYLKTMEVHEKITKKGIEETIKTRKKELNQIEKIKNEEKKVKQGLDKINKAILACNEHLRIIRDPTTTVRQLMDKYGTDNSVRAERKILRLLNLQKNEYIILQRKLRELEKRRLKLQSIK